ncbi:putative WD repeat-containing protein C27B12.05 [Choanephora cucurbitarum]|uniref:Putative WD repeat-containing protein C27B12.05 n=1 Tax=Choanephora cucurbitarum TaxID=101091 RepID=A0A1C7NAH6_9FUNG|nr:putative WD repeat-containing protein C27B12.05 [Choanephora cucurbitarum]
MPDRVDWGRPVDQVLEDYDLLDLDIIQDKFSINLSTGMLWRMNLCAVSQVFPCTFFVAINYRLQVHELDTIISPFKEPIKTLVSPNATADLGNIESPFVINAIKLGNLLGQEVVVTVAGNGEICIWKTNDLNAPPLVLNNHQESTWGIALHDQQGLLAVSANNFLITVYNMAEIDPAFFNVSTSSCWLGSQSSIQLRGHTNNIPCIDFNQSGRYLASGSIDTSCRVWDLKHQREITRRNPLAVDYTEAQDHWFWSVKFIQPGQFKYTVCLDKEVNHQFMRRHHQGRSTLLHHLDLHHSAKRPAYPIAITHGFDLDGETVQWDFYSMARNNDDDEEEEDEDYQDLSDQDQALLQDEFNMDAMAGEYEEDEYEDEEDDDDDDGEQLAMSEGTFDLARLHDLLQSGPYSESIPVGPGGWDDSDESVEQASMSPPSPPSSEDTTEATTPSLHIIPNTIQTKHTPSLQSHLGEYLMTATGKDVSLMSTRTPQVTKIHTEHGLLGKVDVRQDELLNSLDRINMVEWIPELELFVAASQKGTVALMRVLQVEWLDGSQHCMFNNEYYLPNSVLESTPLYGMTVKKVKTERFSPVAYQIFLFYYSGTVLGYTISHRASDIQVDNLFI